MITEDYVSFETAKLLKEKGFDWDCKQVYDLVRPQSCADGKMYDSFPDENPNAYGELVSAPTLQMAMKWLREKHSCFITLSWDFDKYDDNRKPVFGKTNWQYNISIPKWNSARTGDGSYFDMYSEEEFPTYEEALEASINYCLKNLI